MSIVFMKTIKGQWVIIEKIIKDGQVILKTIAWSQEGKKMTANKWLYIPASVIVWGLVILGIIYLS